MNINRRSFIKVSLGALGTALFVPHIAFSNEKPVDSTGKYYVVRFNSKRHKWEPEDVQLTLNGNTLVIKRDKYVIMPESFLEICDHAKSLSFNKGKRLKVYKTFSYKRIREVSEKEYVKFMRKCNA